MEQGTRGSWHCDGLEKGMGGRGRDPKHIVRKVENEGHIKMLKAINLEENPCIRNHCHRASQASRFWIVLKNGWLFVHVKINCKKIHSNMHWTLFDSSVCPDTFVRKHVICKEKLHQIWVPPYWHSDSFLFITKSYSGLVFSLRAPLDSGDFHWS